VKRRKVKIEIKDEILDEQVSVPGDVAIHSIHKTEENVEKKVKVKTEVEESPFFASETTQVVKTEPEDESNSQLLNEDGEISKSNLMQESADIEDLVQ